MLPDTSKAHLDLRQLRHFVAVCEHRNYARASDALGASQSTIIKSVAKLETLLDAKLLSRGRFGATPTPFGDALAQRARAGFV